MKYQTSAVLCAVLCVTFLLEIFFKVDLVLMLFSCHNHKTFLLDAILPVLFVAGAGLIVDYMLYALKKKEAEKDIFFRQTIFGMNHLVRSLQSKFVMITDSEAVKKEFGDDLVKIFNQSSEDIENILNKLAELGKADPEIVKEILATPSRCNICGCERVNFNISSRRIVKPLSACR